MRKLLWMILGLWLCGLPAVGRADTYSLADGTSVSGDVVSFNDIGIIFRTGEDKYSDRVSWTKFSQDGLKQLAENPKIKPFVEPFIEIPESELPHRPPVKIADMTQWRLELPPKSSLLGALFSSSVGLVALLLIYAANIYAGFEAAIFRGRPKFLAMGVAALLPVLGPVIFLSLPTYVEPVAAWSEDAAASAAGEAQRFAMPGAALQPEEIQVAAASSHAPPAAQIFQRGQFTFNRRFFETKFPGFFSVVRRDADKDKMLTVKTLRGTFVVQRITRINADAVHLQIVKGAASYEEMVPFAEIQEIQLA